MDRWEFDKTGDFYKCDDGDLVKYCDYVDEVNYLRGKLQEIYDCGDYGMRYHDIAAEALGVTK